VSTSSEWCIDQLCTYNANLPHYQVSHDQRSWLPSEGMLLAGTHPISPSQYHLDQNFEILERAKSQQIPQKKTARGSAHCDKVFREWRCPYCNRKYGRVQELQRHITDKHHQPQKCPFCHVKWTRPVKIRAHILTDHKDSFTEDEQQEIRRLRGRNDTISFLANHGIKRLPEVMCSVLGTAPRQGVLPPTPWNCQR
jgi:hypothetical protein